MTRPDVRCLDTDLPRCSATRGRLLAALLTLGLALSIGSPGQAQLGEDLQISVAPNPATTDDPLVVTVTGTASCPELHDPRIFEDKIVDVPFSDECLLLPPSPGPFTLFTLIDPLDPGIWTINLLRVIDIPHNPDMVVDTVTVTVTDPAFSVELVPSPATEDDEVVAHLTGFAHDPELRFPLDIEPGRIRIVVGECGLCDPPSAPSTFQLQQSLGRLEAGEYLVELFYIEDRVAESVLQVLPGAPKCLPGRHTLCLGDGRFKVEATWTTPGDGSGPARAVEETADAGLFWFFGPDNIELVVKVLDACDTEFETFWVFAGGLTDVGVAIEVTDTDTGDTVRYENPVGRRFETVADTAAFDTCP